MEDLIIDGIVEKLTSMDQRTIEISKLVGEIQATMKDLKQGFTALESECKKAQLRIPQHPPLNSHAQVAVKRESKLGFDCFPARTLPHLISKSALAIFCIYLTVGLRVASPAIQTPILEKMQLPGSDTAAKENIRKLRKEFPKELRTPKASSKTPVRKSDPPRSGSDFDH